MAGVPFPQFRRPLGLLLTPNISTYLCRETWMEAILSELESLKVGENRKISRFLQFS